MAHQAQSCLLELNLTRNSTLGHLSTCPGIMLWTSCRLCRLKRKNFRLLGDTGADRVEVGLGFGSDMGSIDDTALVEASTDLKDVSDPASFEQFGHFWSSAP
ncbi:hypothetical protein KQX54_014015 [Cotesia glomerata]|uniref:Uncharacterized protein n=1 Tax=Cotesia glomerata TaxID=32391 RepID=A0AAV7HTV8_COTGL|nr:hypothetical protein KQX54_014015 [Cotesia glomerata]